ncbi:Gfo/Idh/MocA family oxidoreductase [Enterobacter hormaechei]
MHTIGPDYFPVWPPGPRRRMTSAACAINEANPDDTFEAQLFYGDLKAIVKTSHLVKIDYPKFIVHGKKGSFISTALTSRRPA